jgi:transcription elongation factor GreB
MSRAFVHESDDDFSADDVPAIKDPLPPGVKNYMTPDGAERIKRELHELNSREHPRLAARVSMAIRQEKGIPKEELGKERRRLREIERRIEYLTLMFNKLEVVDPNKQNPDQVLFGAKVTVEVCGEQQCYRIVGIDESDPSSGRISWISPLARALLSKKLGETAQLDLPGGTRTYNIKKIEYM